MSTREKFSCCAPRPPRTLPSAAPAPSPLAGEGNRLAARTRLSGWLWQREKARADWGPGQECTWKAGSTSALLGQWGNMVNDDYYLPHRCPACGAYRVWLSGLHPLLKLPTPGSSSTGEAGGVLTAGACHLGSSPCCWCVMHACVPKGQSKEGLPGLCAAPVLHLCAELATRVVPLPGAFSQASCSQQAADP